MHTLDLLLDPITEERATVEVGGINNQKWKDMMKKTIEALGKAHSDFWFAFDRYELSFYDNSFDINVYLESGIKGEISMLGTDLFPAEMIRKFSERGGAIPDDLDSEYELEACKNIMKKLWTFWKI